jgi:multiple sugar transport system permease protein
MPFLWQIITSIKSSKEVFSIPPTYLPHKISLESYHNVFTVRPFHRYIINSIIVASGTTFLAISIGSLASYALSRLLTKGAGLIKRMILVVALFPQVIFIIPLFELVRNLGLMNNPIALILPYTTINLPFVVWVLTGFFNQIPREIEDAAKVDGFSRIGILTRIMLPLSAPALATTAIIVFIFSWNEFLFALLFMTNDLARTVPVGIAMLSGVTIYEVPWDQISAAIVVTTLPLVLVVLIFQKKIVHGLTAGAIKG